MDEVFGGVLGNGRSWEGWPRHLWDEAPLMHAIETAFGAAHWYGRTADPYPRPEVPLAAPLPGDVPVLEATRRLWLGRWNPADPSYQRPDILDERQFPWEHPEAAPRHCWWLSTVERPRCRASISAVSVGDLVICQRTLPDDRALRAEVAQPSLDDSMLVGICAVLAVDTWLNAGTQRPETEVCLLPLARFDHPVPRTTARKRGRLQQPSFVRAQQLPGRVGGAGRFLSAVDWEDAVELLSVCGIAPEALAEDDLALLAARLRASELGNPDLLAYRYDAKVRHSVRHAHEVEAEERAKAWAVANGYCLRAECQRELLAGFDLLFADAHGELLQVEVKGYSTGRLSDVHLQPSQARRAKAAAEGVPPPWRLFAMLEANTDSPREMVLSASEVVELIASGGISVRGDAS